MQLSAYIIASRYEFVYIASRGYTDFTSFFCKYIAFFLLEEYNDNISNISFISLEYMRSL